MARESVSATRWTCDHHQGSPLVVLVPEGETPVGWQTIEGRDACPACCDRREYDQRAAVLRDEALAFATALTSAGVPAVLSARHTFDRLTADVGGRHGVEPVTVSLYREGKATVRWRARAKLPNGRSLDTASPDATRLARTILREVEASTTAGRTS